MSYPKTVIPFFRINFRNFVYQLGMLFLGIQSFAQIEHENQFTNEYQFNRVIGKKTAVELNIGHDYTSGVNETNPFYKNSQLSGHLWIHYFASKKWKISGSLAYIYNKDVPEITNKKSSEIRFSAQGIYYLIKKEYVLTNRFRIEDRILGDENSTLDIVFRFREMVKLVYPISIIKFGKGSIYSIASEEVILKTKGSTTGEGFFDRNRLTAGLGYSFSDTVQFELTYVNEYLPRNTKDKMFNTISTTLIFNDLISVLRKKNGNIPTY
ncbi:Protein of unknown function DUF2490 [Flavobacteriaceae bacterium]